MKKIMVLGLALGIVGLPAAGLARDIGAGTTEISGGTAASFSSLTYDAGGGDELDQDTLSVTLDVLHYVVPNFGVGLSLGYLNVSESYEGFDMESSTTSIGPQLVYNIGISEAASLFVGGGVGFSRMEAEFDGDSEDLDGWYWTAGGGLRFFVSERAAVNCGVAYLSQTLEGDVDIDVSGFRIGAGFSLFL